MRPPKILYKYMKSCEAQALLKMGVFRVGTLYDYKSDEYGAMITDVHEGVLNPRTHVENETWQSETRPELRGFINVRHDAKVSVRNTTFKSSIRSENCYLYCFSDKFCTSLYHAFDSDTCIVIDDPKNFLKILSGTIQGYIYSKKYFLARVQYLNRGATHRELEDYRPELVKSLDF